MKANELRIGNYYKAPIEFKGSVSAQINFKKDRIFVLTKEIFLLLLSLNLEHLIEPILLTEEWLLKFGFNKVIDNGYEDEFEFIYIDSNEQCRITKNKDGYYSYWPEELFGFCIDLGFEPKIHRLQNLYFELNDREFEMK